MEIRVLKYFLAVATEKNISRAARRLHLSQPALSKQLKELEIELGVTLFIRGNREIELTEEGMYLFNKAKEILSLVDQTISNLKEEEEIVGEVYIGGGETRAMSLIAEAAKKMIIEFPNVKIHLSSGTSDYVMEKLDHGLFDFGLVIDPANKQKYESLRIPAKDIWGLLVRNDHILANKSTITARELKGIPLFCSHQTLVENQMSEWLGSSLEHYNFIGSYNLLYNASLMVEAGVGCALCLDGIINTADKKLKFIPLEPELSAGLNLIWKKNQPLSRTAKKFLEKLKLIIDKY